MLNKFKNHIWLYIVLALALILRLAGANHGYPFIFHPDEPTVVRSALGIRFNPNPEHFDWPHLYFYLNFFVYMSFAYFRNILLNLGLRDFISAFLPIILNDNFIFYSLTRVFSGILGVLTIIPVYFVTHSLYGKKAAIFSALALCVAVLHVWYSHYALVDVPMVFLVSVALCFVVQLLKSPAIKNYLASGFLIGLAASTKYNGGLISLTVPIAHFLRVGINKSALLNKNGFLALVASGFAAIAGFLLGTPFAILDLETFTRTDGPKGALWQFTNVGKVDFFTQLLQFFRVLLIDLPKDFGYSTFYIFLLFLVYLVITKKLDKILIFFYTTILLLIFYLSGFEKVRSHYFILTYPFIAVVVGAGITGFLDFFTNRIKYIVIMVIFAVPLVFSISNVITLLNDDTRVLLCKWMQANVKIADDLIYDGGSLKPILETFSKNSIRRAKLLKAMKLNPNGGYLIVSADDNATAEIPADTFAQILVINPNYRKGPKIVVYRYN